jgi:hypothetical protein
LGESSAVRAGRRQLAADSAQIETVSAALNLNALFVPTMPTFPSARFAPTTGYVPPASHAAARLMSAVFAARKASSSLL